MRAFLLVIAGLHALASAAVFNCQGGIVSIIAHADDDLLFQSPDLYGAVSSGTCITTVILTGGDSGNGLSYAEDREAGNEAAYAFMRSVADSYTQSTATFGGQPVVVRTLIAAPQVQHVWFRLPDGNIDGSGYGVTGYQSLRSLYFGTISSITNLPGTSTYTLAALQQALAQILQARQPSTIWTQDYLSDFDSGDHADHIAAARLASSVAGSYLPSAPVSGYMGYPISNFPPSFAVNSPQWTQKSNAFFTYTPYDSAECQSYSACSAAGRPEVSWLQRQYTTSAALSQTANDGSAQQPATLPSGTNIALQATASASSASSGSPARAAIDNVLGGYPGNSAVEWVSAGQTTGAWISLTWSSTYTITAVVLYDRPNTYDWMQGATLTFSGGYSVAVGSLYNDGSATVFTISPPVVASSVQLTVTAVSPYTSNIGLSEFQVYGTLCSGCTPTASNTSSPTNGTATDTPGVNLALSAIATASSQASADQAAGKANDGVATGYPTDYTKEWASAGQGVGAWLLYTWSSPQIFNSIVAFDRPNLNDWITGASLSFDSGSPVTIGGLNNDGSASPFNFSTVTSSTLRFTVTSVGPDTSNVGLAELQVFYFGSANNTNVPPVVSIDPSTDIAMLATATASSSSPDQGAPKAIDGYAVGYPQDYTKEWASAGETNGAWLQLNWPYSVTFDSLVFCDRPNLNDWITGGSVTFGDGSQLTVPSLNNDGTPVSVNFTAVTTNSLRFTVSSSGASSSNIGLSEIYAFYSGAQYNVGGANATNSTSTSAYQFSDDLALQASISASSQIASNPATAAIDGKLGGYTAATGPSPNEWVSNGEGNGAQVLLSWSSPVSISQISLSDRPNLNDQCLAGTLTFGDSSTLATGTLPNDGTWQNVTVLPPRLTSSLIFTCNSVSSTTSNIGLSEIAVFGSIAGGSSNSTGATNSTSSGSTTNVFPINDLALYATASASSYAAGSPPSAAIDGILGGYLDDGSGNDAAEWSSDHEGAGAVLILNWPSPVQISQVVLYDRPNNEDQVTSGKLQFDSGAVISVGTLPNSGIGWTINISPPQNTTTLTFTVLSVSPTTSNVGLSEIAVYGAQLASTAAPFTPVDNVFPVNDLALKATATASSFANGSPPSSAVDGVLGGYLENGTGDDSAEWSSDHEGAGAKLLLTWPAAVEINQVVLYDRPNLDDQVLGGTLQFDSGLIVNVGALPNDGTGRPVTISPPQNTTRLLFTVTSASASTSNIGLSEIAAYGSALSNALVQPNFTTTTSASLFLSNGVTSTSFVSASTMTVSANLTSTMTLSSLTSTLTLSNLSSTMTLSSSLRTSTMTISSMTTGTSTIMSGTRTSTVTSGTATSTLATSTQTLSVTSGMSSSTRLSTSTLTVLSGTLSTSRVSTSTQTLLAVGTSTQSLVATTATTSVPSLPSVATQTSSVAASTSVLSTSTSTRPSSTTSTSTRLSTVSTSTSTSRPLSTSTSTTRPLSTTTTTTTTSSTSTRPSSTSARPTITLSPTVNAAKSVQTVVASSFQPQSPPQGAIDGVIGGVTTALIVSWGDASAEWVAVGKTAQWIELRWSEPYLLKRVVLWDRVDPAQNVLTGHLSFSDGKPDVPVGALTSSSSGTTVNLGPAGRVTTFLRFTIDTAAGTNTGLAEIAAYSA